MTLTTMNRAGALALATIISLALASPAWAQTRFERLEAPSSVDAAAARQSPGDGDRGGTARTVASIARANQRPAFPVRGPFNWGQEAAAFGGPRSGRSHEGQDVLSRTGTPVVAVRSGEVLETGNDGGRGNYLNLYDPVGKVTYVYMHLEQPASVAAGDRVTGGQRVGAVGCTGSCFGDHLHFEIRAGRGSEGVARDPRPELEKWAGADAIPATLPPGQS
jgi:murein DD-endopeptidase MepM/ murein hydrolase activator NlpD